MKDRHLWIDESLIGHQVKQLVSLSDFVMQLWVDVDSILFHETASSLEVTLALDALNFGKQCSENIPQCGIISDLHIGLTLTLNERYSSL